MENQVPWSDQTKPDLSVLSTKSLIWWKPITAPHPENTVPAVKHGSGSIIFRATHVLLVVSMTPCRQNHGGVVFFTFF